MYSLNPSFLPPDLQMESPQMQAIVQIPRVCAVNLQKVAQHSCPIMYGCIAATVYGLPTRPSKLLRWWSTVCLIQYTVLYSLVRAVCVGKNCISRNKTKIFANKRAKLTCVRLLHTVTNVWRIS